jgi:two-component system cell cycle sensor histidine kinase/response regulator CckA
VDRKTFTPTQAAFLELVCPADRERVARTAREPHHFEAGAINPDGRVWIMEGFGHLTCDVAGKPVRLSGTIQDVTERRVVEVDRLQFERLVQSQKFQSLGTLAGGIAHQFNNLMNVVTLNLEMALHDSTVGPLVRPRIASAVLAVERAAELTRQILSYSGKGRFFVESLDLSELVSRNQHLFQAGVAKDIRLELQCAERLPAVEVDANQVKQAIMSLAINAAEAIEEKRRAAAGGAAGPEVISIATGVAECDQSCLQPSRTEDVPPPGTYGYVEVSDTGCGMDDTTKRRLFDPFFSTKFLGRGLGMAAVLGIVRSHRGAIFVDSRPGGGTTVRLLFPVAPQT